MGGEYAGFAEGVEGWEEGDVACDLHVTVRKEIQCQVWDKGEGGEDVTQLTHLERCFIWPDNVSGSNPNCNFSLTCDTLHPSASRRNEVEVSSDISCGKPPMEASAERRITYPEPVDCETPMAALSAVAPGGKASL